MDTYAGPCEIIARKYNIQAEFCSCADDIS